MSTSESFRRSVADKLDEVVKSSDPSASVSFDSCLSAEERKYVHYMAERFGLQHLSNGKGDARFITVRRDNAKLERHKLVASSGSRAPRLVLSAEASKALDHPLLAHTAKCPETLAALERGAPHAAVDAQELARLLRSPTSRTAWADRSGAGGPALAAVGLPETQLLSFRRSLPAWSCRENLLELLSAHTVTMVVGETGCGKSTQIPQFILETDPNARILVTQPRRISALALAHRVSQERGEEVGKSVGYSVHLEHVACSQTRLLYCTTGVFRRQLLADPALSDVTHLVLDELHERDKVADFLLIAIKQLVVDRPSLRVVLMSATMQVDTFRKYFLGCAEVSIPGRVYPVERFFLEDLARPLHEQGYVEALGPGFAAGGLGFGNWNDRNKEKSFKYQVLVSHARDPDGVCGFGRNARLPLNGDRLEEGLFLHDILQQTKGVQFDLPIVEALLAALVSHDHGSATVRSGGTKCLPLPSSKPHDDGSAKEWHGAILCFLPGWDDIDRLKRRLRQHPVLGDRSRCMLLPLHGQIRLEEQREVFKTPPPGVRKIILSTNIAETSLTIDDVVVVLDCGRAKETSFDACLSVPTLNTSWISRASMAQRAGRAGRTRAGVCYHLFSRRRVDLLDEHRPPELLRSPLEDLCLHSKLLLTRQGRAEVSAMDFLRRAPDPPEERSVQAAERLLCQLGALTSDGEGSVGGRLTALGAHLSALPLAPQLAKVLLWACLLGVGDDALHVVSGLQYRDPFVAIGDAQQATSLSEANRVVREAKRALCQPHPLSDHLALLQATLGFQKALSQAGEAAARKFCEQFSLSFRAMQSLKQTSAKLRKELQGFGLWSSPICTRNSGDVSLLIAAIGAGLFPNVAHGDFAGGVGRKLRAASGRLEAVPHSSSVLAPGGDRVVASKTRHGLNRGEEGGQWFCFNELSQVEDNYSLSGLSEVSAAALLLFCGEGPLVIRQMQPDPGPTAENTQPSTGIFASWWAQAASSSSVPSTALRICSEAAPATSAQAVLTIAELGDWLRVSVSSSAAASIQALRAMVGLLFRRYCCDPSNLPEMMGEGQGAVLVLDLVSQLLRSGAAGETQPQQQTGSASALVSPVSGESKDPVSYYNGGGRSRSGRATAAPVPHAPSSQGRWIAGTKRKGWKCGHCGQMVTSQQAHTGGVDPNDGVWYCQRCWSTW